MIESGTTKVGIVKGPDGALRELTGEAVNVHLEHSASFYSDEISLSVSTQGGRGWMVVIDTDDDGMLRMEITHERKPAGES